MSVQRGDHDRCEDGHSDRNVSAMVTSATF